MNGGLDAQSRLVAIQALADTSTRDAVEVLLEIGERREETDELLRAVGSALARLQISRVTVSEWDIRHLAEAAGEAFLE